MFETPLNPEAMFERAANRIKPLIPFTVTVGTFNDGRWEEEGDGIADWTDRIIEVDLSSVNKITKDEEEEEE